MEAVRSPGIRKGEPTLDLVPDAPFANFATATAAMVHFGCLDPGECIEWDEVRRKGVREARSGSVAVSTEVP